jgi:hypothetical protein
LNGLAAVQSQQCKLDYGVLSVVRSQEKEHLIAISEACYIRVAPMRHILALLGRDSAILW